MKRVLGTEKALAGALVTLVLSAALICLPGRALGEPFESGVSVTPISEPRAFAATVYDDGRILVIGGSIGYAGTSASLATVLIYDTATGETSRGRNMITGVAGAAYAKADDGRVYIIGGWNSSVASYVGTVQIYDPVANTWNEAGNTTPVSVGLAASVLGLDGKVYIFGSGWSWNTTLIYDPLTDEWRYGADLPIPGLGGTAVAYSPTEIFLIGSLDGDNSTSTNRVWVYNPVTNSWREAGSLLTSLAWPSAVLGRNGFIYAFGGTDQWFPTSGATTLVQRYNATDDSWDYASDSMDWARACHQVVVDELDRIFVVGGLSGASAISAVEVFVVSDISGLATLAIVSPADGAIVSDVVSIQVGVSNSPFWWMVWFVTVDLYIDGELYESQSAGSQWVFLWDTSTLPDGSTHDILARGFSYDGTVSEDSITVTVSAQSVAEKVAAIEQQIAVLESDIAGLQAMVEDLNGSVAVVQSEIDALQSQANSLQNELNAISGVQEDHGEKLASLNNTLANLQSQLDDLQDQLDKVKSTSDSSNTMGMVNLILLVVIIVLLAVMFIMARKTKTPPPPGN